MNDIASKAVQAGRPRIHIADDDMRAVSAGELAAERLAARLGCAKITIIRRARAWRFAQQDAHGSHPRSDR